MALCLLPLILTVTTACGRSVDYKQTLQVTDLSGGWYDFGIVDGKNKLVPSVSFRVRKTTDVSIRSLSINVHFKKISIESPQSRDAEEEMSEVFLQGIEFSDGNQTRLLTFRPDTGVTGDPPQTRAEMLAHRLFRDVRARVFVKQSSTTWVDLATYDLPRVLLSK
ncbi:MAG TPA: hypothetical protein VH740_09230 [Vicinamibacterales bacterium]|jgi:hypothetical protein